MADRLYTRRVSYLLKIGLIHYNPVINFKQTELYTMKKITVLFTLFTALFTQAQDTCGTAVTITAGTHVVTAVDGTELPPSICAANGALGTDGAAEWYTYTPAQNYTIILTTDIAANTPRVDTRVHVYTGTCGALTCFAGDDDSGANYSTVATFNVTAGTTY